MAFFMQLVVVLLITMTVFLFKMMQKRLPFKLNLFYSQAALKPFSPFCPSPYLCAMQLDDLYQKAVAFEFLKIEEGIYLYHHAPLADLMFIADELRKKQVPHGKV